MVEEAAEAGAHGVVGVVDTSYPLADMGVLEFKVQGTAVRVAGGHRPRRRPPWTTYLAGQRLAKLVEAGYAPVSVAASVASVRVWANCVTANLTEGSNSMYSAGQPGSEIDQTVRAHRWSAVWPARVRDQLEHDSLHGAALVTTERELGEGDAELQCILRGNRVRRFKDVRPHAAAGPTVRLL